MKTDRLYPRFAAQRLAEALKDSPVVLIHGPRQSGKTTFARMAGERLGFTYFSFDDHVLADAAEADPIGFVEGLPERSILDEVQRVPGIFPALKMAVDRHRIPGWFLLTQNLWTLTFSDAFSGSPHWKPETLPIFRDFRNPCPRISSNYPRKTDNRLACQFAPILRRPRSRFSISTRVRLASLLSGALLLSRH
jgi:hypothetical protein